MLAHVDVLSALLHQFPIVEHQRDVGHFLQSVLILRNEDAIVHLATVQLRMGMPADNQVNPGEEGGAGHVFLKAIM